MPRPSGVRMSRAWERGRGAGGQQMPRAWERGRGAGVSRGLGPGSGKGTGGQPMQHSKISRLARERAVHGISATQNLVHLNEYQSLCAPLSPPSQHLP